MSIPKHPTVDDVDNDSELEESKTDEDGANIILALR